MPDMELFLSLAEIAGVFVDELTPDPRKPSSERTAGFPWNWTEADFRRVLEDAGFTDVVVRYKPVLFLADNRVACYRKPPAPRRADEGTAPATAGEEPATAPEAVAVG